MESPKLKKIEPILGCDPEIFLSKDGKIMDSEKILKEGETVYSNTFAVGQVISDGVQAELNPKPDYCREVLIGNIARCLQKLHSFSNEAGGSNLNFRGNINLSDEDFNSLSSKSKKLGCKPSMDAYEGGNLGNINVDPKKHRGRSAGGHIHLGEHKSRRNTTNPVWRALKQPTELALLMDIVVGNTCVLLDREKGNVERRKVYGRAGEFRTPEHGFEYRTLSNFWLRHPALASFVFGLARHALVIQGNELQGVCEWGKKLTKSVSQINVRKAVNKNDFDLAQENFNKMVPVLVDSINPDTSEDFYPLDNNNLTLFRHFVKKGLDYWFKENPLQYWTENRIGFRDFLEQIVYKDLHPIKSRIKGNKK